MERVFLSKILQKNTLVGNKKVQQSNRSRRCFMQLSKEPLGSGSKGNAGFTLIELAIVLIIIGLIMAAVIKSSDLINDAQITDFIANPVHELAVDAMAYYEKTGTFPSGNSTQGPLYNMFEAGIKDVINIRNPYTASGNSLGVALGVIHLLNSDGSWNNYPVIVIEPVSVSSNGTISSVGWTTSTLNYAIRLKTIIDGNQNWSAGAVRIFSSTSRVGVVFNSLYSEIQSQTAANVQITNYDGYVPSVFPYTETNGFVEKPSSISGTKGDWAPLVYFYYKTPY